MSKSLRDIAVELSHEEQQKPLENSQKQRTLLFVGSKGMGKTTLINRFLDRNESAKKTLALEYTFARKTGRSLVKDVCHIWELGGGTLFTPLLSTAQSLTSSASMTLVLVLDLSQLNQLWTTLETLLNVVKNTSSAKPPPVHDDHPDKAMLNPFPVPLVIIGGKYDIFQDFEPEKKRIVCRCLRFVAHIYCSTLVFYSSKDPTLVKRVKDILNHYGFGSQIGRNIVQDYNKPLIIPAGTDCLENIEGLGSTSAWTMDKVKHLFTTHFTQEISKVNNLTEDPAKDTNFREPLIDSLRRQKDEELERYCQEIERRQKLIPAV